jgi:prepilin peptidase CpaA
MVSALRIVSDAAVFAGVAMLVVAALHDIVARTVPNGIAVGVAAAGVIAQTALSLMGVGQLLISLPVAVAVFFLAALLWRRGLMGGADVKLFGASALLVPPMLVPSMVMCATLAGGVLALIYLVARRRAPERLALALPGGGRRLGLFARAVRVERWRLRRGGPLPYAVAIAGGVLFVMSHGGVMS